MLTDSPAAALDALIEHSDRGLPLAASAYTDPALFELEKHSIFARSTVALASMDTAPRPGDWQRVRAYDPRLVIARAADLERYALFDVCRHRGAGLLADEPSGHARELCIECPYHRWRYGLDGAALRTRGSSEPLLRARCEARGAQLWARFDDAVYPAFSLPDWLTELDRAPLARVHTARWEVRANWKLVIENFVESHHFESVHPELERWTPWRRSRSRFGAWTIEGEMPLAEDAQTVSPRGEREGRPWIVADEGERRIVRDAYVFPNALYSRQPDYLLAYRVFATAVDRCEIECDTLVHGGVRAAPDVIAFWSRVHDEDRQMCESQQRCARSRGWAPIAFEQSEDGVRAFDAMIARALRAQKSGA